MIAPIGIRDKQDLTCWVSKRPVDAGGAHRLASSAASLKPVYDYKCNEKVLIHAYVYIRTDAEFADRSSCPCGLDNYITECQKISRMCPFCSFNKADGYKLPWGVS